ncbi:hypothetical protein AB836_00995 [Rickettsiales bacterium (ex Bugula neritina AB1)]|nr:hypothetical protein AB836_00995 [Rickettsiales bacterium (ex Bugula neritina AB1)]
MFLYILFSLGFFNYSSNIKKKPIKKVSRLTRGLINIKNFFLKISIFYLIYSLSIFIVIFFILRYKIFSKKIIYDNNKNINNINLLEFLHEISNKNYINTIELTIEKVLNTYLLHNKLKYTNNINIYLKSIENIKDILKYLNIIFLEYKNINEKIINKFIPEENKFIFLNLYREITKIYSFLHPKLEIALDNLIERQKKEFKKNKKLLFCHVITDNNKKDNNNIYRNIIYNNIYKNLVNLLDIEFVEEITKNIVIYYKSFYVNKLFGYTFFKYFFSSNDYIIQNIFLTFYTYFENQIDLNIMFSFFIEGAIRNFFSVFYKKNDIYYTFSKELSSSISVYNKCKNYIYYILNFLLIKSIIFLLNFIFITLKFYFYSLIIKKSYKIFLFLSFIIILFFFN